jgi:hypothetical protein
LRLRPPAPSPAAEQVPRLRPRRPSLPAAHCDSRWRRAMRTLSSAASP